MPGWGYALNQWKPGAEDFLRRDEHERALKTIAVCGFSGVELRAGRDRWEPLGNAEEIKRNFGSPCGLREFVQACGVDSIPSFFYDPAMPREEEPFTGRAPQRTEDHDGIVAVATDYARLLGELGGSVLVIRPTGMDTGALSELDLGHVAACWNAVGAATNELGVRAALHFDQAHGRVTAEHVERIVDLTDPGTVGVAIDTAELTLLGIDPVSFFERRHSRVVHIHLKDVRSSDDPAVLCGRRFWEMGLEGGLVDFTGLVAAARERGYKGWMIVESDETLDPAASVMLNGWYVREVLSAGAAAQEAAAQ
jgi:inosose dehydratase